VRGQNEWAEKMFTAGIAHDFGTVPHGVLLFHQFKVTNIYSVPLEVLARPGCGCATTEVSPKVLRPKEQGTLDVHMDARKFSGPKNVVINVRVLGADNNAGPKFDCWTKLTVTANSRVDVLLTPGQISFPVIVAGERSAPQSLEVEYVGGLDWQVTELDRNRAPMEASFRQVFRRPGHIGYQVTVTPSAEVPLGPFRYQLLLRTNDPVNPAVPILVEGTVQGPLRLVPESVDLGHTKVGESVTKLVMVKGSTPFRVLAIEGLDESVTAELPQRTAKVQVIKLTYQPTKEGKLYKKVLVRTDLEKQRELTLTIEGAAGRRRRAPLELMLKWPWTIV
jgi:hypothetical protein